ncbi:MAG TPA: VOC family protein [Bacteroidia bacterium]|jgi:uncharacterized glyoxalase superfamily protein PhnB|nr:VOC family protein [Bacteroidia bacterium]HQF27649.1 VOC family protein [Bacteroidia bacterium]HQK98896.1 VOC family protein [Bacteroidia bacterium]
MNSVAPNIFVNDLKATIEFYKHLGFTVTVTVPEEGDLVWVMMTNGSVVFMFQSFTSLGDELPEIKRSEGGSLLLYIQVNNIRDFFEDVSSKVKILKGLEKTFYGATEFSVLDNNGYVLTFAEDEK